MAHFFDPAPLENNLSQITAVQAGLPAVLRRGEQEAQIADPLVQNILTSLQKITDGIATLDKRISAYRSSHHLAHISRIHPKTRTVIFSGGSFWGDNSKYAYLAFQKHARHENIACYFLPHNAAQYQQLREAQLPCLPHDFSRYTPEEIDILLCAKILVVDNHFVPPNWRNQTIHALLSGAKIVQMWHGIPLKKIGLETLATANLNHPDSLEFFAACGNFDLFVAPSAASCPDWQRKFAFQNFAPIGYPRNDVFFRELSPSDKINVDAQVLAAVQQAHQKGRPVIVYAPTFRDHEGSSWFTKAGIAALADYCRTKNYLFYVNLHPAEHHAVEQFRLAYPTLSFIAPHSDIYPIVKYASVLITDYSSLALDFLLLDRPILFYRPDHTHYVTRSRSLIEDHADYVCGAVVSALPDLVSAVEETVAALSNPAKDIYCATRLALRHKLFDHQDGMAAQRLNGEIVKLMEM